MLNKLSLAMLDVLLTHKEGLAGNTDIGGSLGSSDYEIAKLKILREVRKINSRIATLEFRRADFVSCRHFVGRTPQKTALKGPGELTEAQEQSVLICSKLSRYGRRPAWLNGELLTEIKSET